MSIDHTLKAVYARIVRDHGASVDDILVDPALREQFLSNSREFLGTDVGEETLLRRLQNLRKQSKLPRSGDILAKLLVPLVRESDGAAV